MGESGRGIEEGLGSKTAVMVDQLRELVETESGSSDLEGLAKCAAVVERLGFDVLGSTPERVETTGRVHLVWKFGPASRPPAVLLVGHFDTVWPRGTLDGWPFAVDGDRATGPGAFDMKAGIVQMFHGLATLDRAGGLDGIACVLTSDEELGSPTSRALIEGLAAGARAALVLEPSAGGGALKVARKGVSLYQIDIGGRAAHAGLEPEKGANATVELAHQVLALTRIARPDLGTTVTPTVCSAGTTTNTVPVSATLAVDVRASTQEEQDRVDEAVRSLSTAVDGTSVDVGGGPNRPPMDRNSSTALFELARQVAGTLGLRPLEGASVGGGSDGNFTAGIGVPTLDGLGAVGDGAHAPGEWVSVAAMAERAALLAGLVDRIRRA